MSAPVDVLAVIEDKFGAGEIVAAVQELVEADREYDEALRLANIGYGTDYEAREAHQRLRLAVAQRSAALAKFGGAA